MDWGNVPEWVAAVSATLAFVIAGYAARYAYRQVQHLEHDTAERREIERRAQASFISSWIDGGGPAPYVVCLLNVSKQPVYRLTHVFISPNNYNAMSHRILPPADGPQIDVGMTEFINSQRESVKSIDMSWDPFTSDEVQRMLRAAEEGRPEEAKTDWKTGVLALRLFFTDANGVRWERRVDGTLVERPHDYDAHADMDTLGLGVPTPRAIPLKVARMQTQSTEGDASPQ